MRHADIHRLLLECGFRNQLWPPQFGQHWAVIGELAGGARMVITCMPSPTGFRVHVAPPFAGWLRDWLIDNDLDAALLSTRPVEAARDPSPPRLPYPSRSQSSWLELGLGLGAVLLFAWVLWR